MIHHIRSTARKIGQRIDLAETLVYRQRHPLDSFRFLQLDDPDEKPPITDDASGWEVIDPDSYWARRKTNFVLRSSFQIPSDWDKNTPIALYLPLGEPGSFSHPEAQVYIDGEPYATCDRHHQEVLLDPKWHDGKTHQIALHGWTGNSNRDGNTARLFMRLCYVVQVDQPARDFLITARVALETANTLEESDPVKNNLLNALDDAFKVLDIREPFGDHFYESVPEAHNILKAGIETSGHPLDVDIIAAGHAHIDVAWLWTLGQVRRKTERTFTTALRLMEQFPDYHFTQSQPQLYDYVRNTMPHIFDAIKERVKEGRWELIGGMWVESDCNVTGPESLARQFLLGRSFFEKHFGEGVDTPVLWLPDVFGYAWNLPQLIKEAECEYFFTIKIGWNLVNRLPYDSFWWQGLDGTKVLTHFSTTPSERDLLSNATYNAFPTPGTTIYTWRNLQQKAESKDILMAYGYGDGGGGPTREMLENIGEMGEFPGVPRIKTGRVGDFFRKLDENSGDKLPTWNGELYLEVHRGTYTTQSRNKRANRRSEFMLHDAEYLGVLAALLDPDYVYPENSFRKAWEIVCLNQFHDIIPGSSITEVYVESLQQYAEVHEMAQAAQDAALAAITKQVAGDVVVLNTTSFHRNDLALWNGTLADGKSLYLSDGTAVMSQPTAGGTLIAAGEVKPYSVLPLAAGDAAEQPETGLSAATDVLENNYVRVEINGDGDIVRFYDKMRDREVLPEGTVTSQFVAFEDRPLNWDAWDFEIFYDDKAWFAEPADSIELVESGPLRATLEIKRKILNSTYTQRIALSYNSPRVDVTTHIDWNEKHILLKAMFPVDVLSPKATYEIQWGNVERPTHRNTSWDWARFESCAQKWVDLSEGGYGMSLLNDCKYGHTVRGNVIEMSLLRAPTNPDEHADEGEHTFTYSLLPHSGTWSEDTIGAAYALNDPLVVAEGQGVATHDMLNSSLLTTDRPNVVIETVKQADDGNGIIVRLYETHRMRCNVTLSTTFRLGAAYRSNIIENDGEAYTVSESATATGSDVTFEIKPYQIITLRLVPA